MDKEAIATLISKLGLFLGLFFITTSILWVIWNLTMPLLGVPKLGYWTFAGVYVLFRGLTTDITKRG